MNSIRLTAACFLPMLCALVPAPVASAVHRGPDARTLTAQVLLDRTGFGPGVIDGHGGSSFARALRGFQEARGLPATGKLDPATSGALAAYSDTPGTIEIVLTPADLAGPFVGPIPDDPAGHARIVREGGLPVAAGENLRTLWEFKLYIAGGGVTFPEPDGGTVTTQATWDFSPP